MVTTIRDYEKGILRAVLSDVRGRFEPNLSVSQSEKHICSVLAKIIVPVRITTSYFWDWFETAEARKGKVFWGSKHWYHWFSNCII